MKYLRIILVYITVIMMAACAGNQVTPSNDTVKAKPPVELTLRNVYDVKFNVIVQNWTRDHVRGAIIGASVKPGEQMSFNNSFTHGDVYDIKWYKTDGTHVHWFTFKVTAGTIHVLSYPYHSMIIADSIDSEFEFKDNTKHIKN